MVGVPTSINKGKVDLSFSLFSSSAYPSLFAF